VLVFLLFGEGLARKLGEALDCLRLLREVWLTLFFSGAGNYQKGLTSQGILTRTSRFGVRQA
jgi:hypothetical protein